MLKKWTKFIKILATTLIFLIYLTMEIHDRETLKEEKSRGRYNYPTESTTSGADKYSGTIKTIVSYSKEYKLRMEIEDRIECQARILPKRGNSAATTQWRQDRNLGIRLFSSYYDRRQDPHNYVRTIGLMPRNLSLYCQIWYETEDAVTHVTQKAIGEEIWSASWKAETEKCEEEYPVIISCLAPSRIGIEPSWVSFVDANCVGGQTFTEIVSPPRPSAKKNFVVCVKPLHFTNLDEKTFREWMEINYRLGAEKIVVYLCNSTSLESISRDVDETGNLVRKRFEYPETECTVRNFEGSVWYRRKMEIIAYNDCFYRNLHSARFVIPLDVDEIIVPKTGNGWFDAFRSHFRKSIDSHGADGEIFWPENYASFSVRNAYFFSKYPLNAIVRDCSTDRGRNSTESPAALPTSVSGSIFDRTLRSCRLSPKSDSVKSFVHVTETLSVFNHFAFHVLNDATQQYIFPPNVFQLNHYRNNCDPILIDGCRDFLNRVVHDDSLVKLRRNMKTSDAGGNDESDRN